MVLDLKNFKNVSKNDISTIFGVKVKNPERYGVANFDNNGKILSIDEKPKTPKKLILP